MTNCIYPNCPKKATIGCSCHIMQGGWWCYEHIENHYEAIRLNDETKRTK